MQKTETSKQFIQNMDEGFLSKGNDRNMTSSMMFLHEYPLQPTSQPALQAEPIVLHVTISSRETIGPLTTNSPAVVGSWSLIPIRFPGFFDYRKYPAATCGTSSIPSQYHSRYLLMHQPMMLEFTCLILSRCHLGHTIRRYLQMLQG